MVPYGTLTSQSANVASLYRYLKKGEQRMKHEERARAKKKKKPDLVCLYVAISFATTKRVLGFYSRNHK